VASSRSIDISIVQAIVGEKISAICTHYFVKYLKEMRCIILLLVRIGSVPRFRFGLHEVSRFCSYILSWHRFCLLFSATFADRAYFPLICSQVLFSR
jgi:hypothetical protein